MCSYAGSGRRFTPQPPPTVAAGAGAPHASRQWKNPQKKQQRHKSPQEPNNNMQASHSREPGLCRGRGLIQNDDGQVVDALQGHHNLQAAEER
jgi:hypothetical protein